MRIKVINPNTTTSFTRDLQVAAAAVAAPGTVIEAGNPSSGTPSIESHVDEALATIGVIAAVEAGEAAGIDGYVVACFGDTGVAAARELARGPVVGMTEAALYAACLVASTFTIITLPTRTRRHALRVVQENGLAPRCTRVRAVDIPVLGLADKAAEAAVYAALLAEARRSLDEDHAEAIVLGCAGLSHFVTPMSEALGVPVIDGVTVAVKMVEGLVALGLGTSKRSSFGYPPAKGRTMAAGR
jgi:allantoin racemase